MTSPCPTCGSDQFDTFGDVPVPTCGECGLVISDEVDPPDPVDTSTQENPGPWGEYYSVTNSTEQQTAHALEHVETFRRDLRLSKAAVEQTVDVLVEASVENLADGRSTELIVAATVCVGSRATGSPRPVGAVAEISDIETNRLEQAIRLIHRTLGRDYDPVPPHAYVEYLRDELSLTERARDRAIRVVERYEESYAVSGKDPVGIAAAGVYRVATDQVTQREVADVAGITQETIRVRLTEMPDPREVA